MEDSSLDRDRRRLLKSAGASLLGLGLAGCSSNDGAQTEQPDRTITETATETQSRTATDTVTATETDNPAQLDFDLGDPELLPIVTEGNRDRSIEYTAQARDPDGLQYVELALSGQYSDGETVLETQEPNGTTQITLGGKNGDSIDAARMQPGTNTFTLVAEDSRGNTYRKSYDVNAPDAPFLADLDNATEREWDDVGRDLDSVLHETSSTNHL